ncbi:MAG: hypothetical protein IPO08_22900 [Xanthomonadales bacterium]|nr:hypothetical protein [Xanthomonadales bacterium]
MTRNTKTQDTSTISDIDDAATDSGAVAASAPEAPAVATGLPSEFSGKRRYITLHPGDGELGRAAQPFGINGYVILINRSVKVAVPEEFVAHIQNLTTAVVDEKGNPAGEQPRFNITDHGPV